MSLWRPTEDGKKVECLKHKETFPKGASCSTCPLDPASAAEVAAAKKARAKPKRRGVPSTDDHERWFVAISELAEAWAREEDEAVRTWDPPDGDGDAVVVRPTRGTAAKLLAEAIKARRAAADHAARREHEIATERLEKAVRELNDAGPKMRVRTLSSEARH